MDKTKDLVVAIYQDDTNNNSDYPAFPATGASGYYKAFIDDSANASPSGYTGPQAYWTDRVVGVCAIVVVPPPLPPPPSPSPIPIMAGMPLVEITINGVVERASMEGYALIHNWRPMVVDYGTITQALPSDHGGFFKMTFGTITFNPLLFKNPAYWPCPASCPIAMYFADSTEGGKVLIFKGTAHMVSYDRMGIKYALYGPIYDDLVTNPTTYTDTLNNVMTSILGLIPEITSVDTSLARSPSPPVDYTVSSDNVLAIDLASQISESFSHLFYIDRDTSVAHLVDMKTYNGQMLFGEKDFFAYATVSGKTPISVISCGTQSQISAYPYGSKSSVTAYATDPTTIEDAIFNIMTIENAPRVKFDIPLIANNLPVPGQKIMAYDTGTVQDEWIWMALRKIIFDF